MVYPPDGGSSPVGHCAHGGTTWTRHARTERAVGGCKARELLDTTGKDEAMMVTTQYSVRKRREEMKLTDHLDQADLDSMQTTEAARDHNRITIWFTMFYFNALLKHGKF